jgi:hypothetical protein
VARLAVLDFFVTAGLIAGLGLVAACEGGGGGGSGGSGSGSSVASVPVKNPGGGFSADLSKKLDNAGSGSDTPERTPGSMQTSDTKTDPSSANGSATSASGGASGGASGTGGTSGSDTKAADTKAADTKPADTKAADSKAADTKPADTKPADTKAADTKPADTKLADTKPADTKAADTKAGTEVKGAGKPPDVSTAPKINGAPIIGSTPSKGPVTVPAELKAVNINLLPNWDRDVEGAGTISFIVKIPGKQETATFVFRYGLEDAKAPADRDAYKKWLADNKIFTSKDDRQKGAAWYLEGIDGPTGRPAFRMVVLYGGKRLICGGTLYKESPLGDLRDQVIIQAKQICESVTL